MTDYEDSKSGGLKWAAELIRLNSGLKKSQLITILETKAEEVEAE